MPPKTIWLRAYLTHQAVQSMGSTAIVALISRYDKPELLKYTSNTELSKNNV